MDPLAAAVIVAVLALGAWERRRQADDRNTERDQWATERAELIGRIQRPDILPRPRPRTDDDKPAVFEPPKDLVAMREVGTVRPLKDPDANGSGDEAA